MNAPAWIVVAMSVGILGLVCLLELGPDARPWLVRRVLRRAAAGTEKPEDEEVPPPVIPSLHRDRSLWGGALTRYTSEGRALPVEGVRPPRLGR